MKQAVTHTYAEIEPMLRKICHKFHRVYGLSFDDLMYEAQWEFMRTYEKWDPGRGASFSTYLYFRTTKHLISFCTDQLKRKSNIQEVELDESIMDPSSSAPPWSDSMRELSLDAVMVARVVVEHPFDFGWFLQVLKPRNTRQYVQALCTHLTENHGWSEERIREALDAIREFLRERSASRPDKWGKGEPPTRQDMKSAIEATWLQQKVGLHPDRVRSMFHESEA